MSLYRYYSFGCLACRGSAYPVQSQRVLVKLEAKGNRHGVLEALNLSVVELFHRATVNADHVVVVFAFIDFKHSFARVKDIA